MIERDEAPGQLAPFFDQIDADKSGGISLAELKAALDFIRGQQ